MSGRRQPLPLGDGSELDAAGWPDASARAIINALPTDADVFSSKDQWDAAGCGEVLGVETPENYIYFLRGELTRLIRIGTTNNLGSRLSTHQSSSAEPLTPIGFMPGGRPLERRFHEAFAAIRHHGAWYYPHPVLRQTIARVRIDE